MKNPHTPYYTLPVCWYDRPDGDSDLQFQQQLQQQQLQQQQLYQGPQLAPTAPITPTTEPQPLSLASTDYLNGFLRTQIGKRVRVEFLIGTGTLLDKSGTLMSVGANYITLRQAESDDIITCDFFSIKFITFML